MIRSGLALRQSRPAGRQPDRSHFFTNELVAKRLELLRGLIPAATRVAVLVSPTYPSAEPTVTDVVAAARAMGLQIEVHKAATSGEISAVFASLARARPDALFVGGDPFFTSRRVQLILLATRHAIPTTFGTRECADAGGLMSYGANIGDAWRQAAVYVGRILKGAKPATCQSCRRRSSAGQRRDRAHSRPRQFRRRCSLSPMR